jgi:hypothetical protein
VLRVLQAEKKTGSSAVRSAPAQKNSRKLPLKQGLTGAQAQTQSRSGIRQEGKGKWKNVLLNFCVLTAEKKFGR